MKNKEKNFISAVVYVHNAENRIEDFLQTVSAVLEENFEHWEIVCVNDFSSDDSLRRIRDFGQRTRGATISVVNLSCFHGLEVAINAGRDLAIGDFVLEFDHSILDFRPEEIMRVYRRALEGYDIVSAAADKRMKLSSRLFYRLFSHFSPAAGYKMRTESFRILSRRVINRIGQMNVTVPYRKAIYANSGLKSDALVYAPVTAAREPLDRKDRSYRREIATDSLLLFTNIGYWLSMVLSGLMLLFTVVIGIYSLVAYLISDPVEGWTSTMLFLSLAFTGLFVVLTIIVRYLLLLLQLVFKRQQYSFESIEKISGGEK